MRGATIEDGITQAEPPFQSTRPVRGATPRLPPPHRIACFNPRAPCGARPSCSYKVKPLFGFNPRAPCGARRCFSIAILLFFRFQSTRPVRGATKDVNEVRFSDYVSIHAPRVGRDDSHGHTDAPRNVSIHAPRVGRDLVDKRHISADQRFNPRAPCGARRFSLTLIRLIGCFNPRAPCGARHLSCMPGITSQLFQSTRPVRGATSNSCYVIMLSEFQSTRPVRGATGVYGHRACHRGFNPRAPCGARPIDCLTVSQVQEFQSTRPVRGATERGSSCIFPTYVSIHAPRAGRDTC